MWWLIFLAANPAALIICQDPCGYRFADAFFIHSETPAKSSD
jgi:hypothetical protein